MQEMRKKWLHIKSLLPNFYISKFNSKYFIFSGWYNYLR